jgi:hypothetical protein
MFDQSGGWKPKLCTKSFFGLARMFQNPHAFASSTVRQKVAAHRGSRSIGASCGRTYRRYRLDDLTAQMVAAPTNNGLPIGLTRPRSVFLVSSCAAERFAFSYGSMVAVDSGQFRLIGVE